MQASFSVTNEMSPIFDVLSLWVKSDKKIVKSISVVHPKAATRRKKTKRKKKKTGMKIEKRFALHGNRILSFKKPIAKLRENIFFFICVFLEKPLCPV